MGIFLLKNKKSCDIIITGDSMANRETRRKQRSKESKRTIEVNNDDNAANVLKTGLIVVGIFIVFYVFTLAVTGNLKLNNNDNDDDNNNNENTNVTIQYDEILAGETFNMKYNEYFVLYYDFSDESAALYNTIMEKYVAEHTDVKIFTVDLAKGFNSIYASEKSNPKVTKIDDLKLNGPTLIKIKNKANVNYSEGLEAIKKVLK